MDDLDNKDYIIVGKIVGVKGLKGELKIKSFTQDLESIVDYEIFDSQLNPYFIESYYFKGDILIALFENINSIEIAQTLVNKNLYIKKSSLPNLQEDNFYYVDLLNLDVLDFKTKNLIGKVYSVDNFGAGDILEIKKLDNSLFMLSFNKANVVNVNLEKKFIEIIYPDEILVAEDSIEKN